MGVRGRGNIDFFLIWEKLSTYTCCPKEMSAKAWIQDNGTTVAGIKSSRKRTDGVNKSTGN